MKIVPIWGFLADKALSGGFFIIMDMVYLIHQQNNPTTFLPVLYRRCLFEYASLF